MGIGRGLVLFFYVVEVTMIISSRIRKIQHRNCWAWTISFSAQGNMIVSSRNSIRKIAKLKKRLESVLIDEAEYPFLKHFAKTLTTLKKHLHDSNKKTMT